ncbi:amidohydrolase [Chryseolinea sp. T2]|uniref:amidohydrolase n=1 Tax=Chryseolinea sp. T2 TaxID=3129255 RepID=UPI003077960C
MKLSPTIVMVMATFATFAQSQGALQSRIDQQAAQVEARVIEWRRWFHEHPELSNREINTGARIAEILKSFGLQVQYPVAKTGVVALLKGGKPGPVVALRSDIDALPITERNALPFASKVTTTFSGRETGVMHACGHDAHMAILLGVAQVLSNMKASLNGTVKFIFQPAEEGAPSGEEGGARLMIKEGVLENPKVDAIFGLHVQALVPAGQINYKSGSFMAAVDGLTITVKGRGAHGASPWDGVDPIVLSGQIVSSLQTIVSRQLDLTRAGAVLTIGTMHAGIRSNIIPETAVMEGTIRTFDSTMQLEMHQRIERTAMKVAESGGGSADVVIHKTYPAVVNNAELAAWAGPSLTRAAGAANVRITPAVTMAEDFSFFQQKVPGFFFFLGVYPEGKPEKPPVHHTPDFMINEKVLITGVKALSTLAIDYMESKKK